jgi:uncharacterized protein YdeI (YjbR/CyaY-like superfamily)
VTDPATLHPKDNLPIITFATAAEFEAWLAREQSAATGVWLKVAKKAAPEETVSVPEALDVALCYGWIDGLRQGLDDHFFLQRFTPRRPRSRWSKINRDKVAALIAAGRMQPAGLAQIEAAKQDGRWDAAYDAASTITVPPDLQAALDANPQAQAFFATLTGSNRYAVLYRIHDAKRPETRARRIETFVAMLARGETVY